LGYNAPGKIAVWDHNLAGLWPPLIHHTVEFDVSFHPELSRRAGHPDQSTASIQYYITIADPLQYALDASAKGIKINAIQIGADSTAQTVMQDYWKTTCGWYEQRNHGTSSMDIEAAIVNMLYSAGTCN
jgi:hypothetical protein